jgi:hypothetical protein
MNFEADPAGNENEELEDVPFPETDDPNEEIIEEDKIIDDSNDEES